MSIFTEHLVKSSASLGSRGMMASAPFREPVGRYKIAHVIIILDHPLDLRQGFLPGPADLDLVAEKPDPQRDESNKGSRRRNGGPRSPETACELLQVQNAGLLRPRLHLQEDFFQSLMNRAHGLWAPRRRLGQHLRYQLRELLGDAGSILSERGRILFQDRRGRRHSYLFPKGMNSREHFVQHRAEGKYVGAVIDGLALKLFGRHVGQGADGRPHPGQFRECLLFRSRSLGRQQPFGQAEVHDLDVAGPGKHDVGRFQVPVNYVFRMGFFECFRDLSRQREGFFEGQRDSSQPLLQAFPFDVLHDDEGNTLDLIGLVDNTDVRVIESGGRPGLPQKALARD